MGSRGVETGNTMNGEGKMSFLKILTGTNGGTVLTPEGRLVHELVWRQKMVDAHQNPRISSAISPEMLSTSRKRLKKIRRELGMPGDKEERRQILSQLESSLLESGFPHWRVIPKDE